MMSHFKKFAAMFRLMLTLLLCWFWFNSAFSQVNNEPAIPIAEIERIERVSMQARDAGDITDQLYQRTILLLRSNPCRGVDRGLDESDGNKWASAISVRQGWHDVKVLQAFSYSGWRILYIDNGIIENPYLFFSDDPTRSPSLQMWGGVAGLFEHDDVMSWVIRKVPGIPEHLAKCFAWHVTFNNS